MLLFCFFPTLPSLTHSAHIHCLPHTGRAALAPTEEDFQVQDDFDGAHVNEGAMGGHGRAPCPALGRALCLTPANTHSDDLGQITPPLVREATAPWTEAPSGEW